MPYYAEVIDGTVTRILVIDADKLASGKFCDPALMVETSIYTHGGVHSEGGTPLRRNLAEIGGSYNAETDEFLPKQPYPSWFLERTDEGDWWKAPKDYPFVLARQTKKEYEWNEEQQDWGEV